MTSAKAANDGRRIALVKSQGSRVVEGQRHAFTQTRFSRRDRPQGGAGSTDRIILQVIGGRLHGFEVESPISPFVRATATSSSSA